MSSCAAKWKGIDSWIHIFPLEKKKAPAPDWFIERTAHLKIILKQSSDGGETTLAWEEDDIRSRQLAQDAGPDSYNDYNVSLTWTFAYESNVFPSGKRAYANFRSQSSCCVCGQFPVPGTSGFPWWISPLRGSDWITLRILLLGEIFSPDQLVVPARTLTINTNFPLGSLKLRTMS